MSSSYREALDNWLNSLNVKADTVIDIGGSQLPVKGRTASWEVNKYLIADLPEPQVGSSKPDIEVDLNGHADISKQADMVFCLEVFEYVYDPVNAMHIISKLMKGDGAAWISWPLVYPVHNPVEDDCLRYTVTGMSRIAATAGLRLQYHLVRRPETSPLEFYRAERMRAAKNYDHDATGYIGKFVHV